jgi:HK97 family phage major capsid protein
MPQFISAKALREKRAEVAKKTTAMAEALQADNEARAAKGEAPREWTEQEAKDWNALDAEYKHLTAQIGIAERVEQVQGDQLRPAGQPDVGRTPTAPRGGASRDGVEEMTALAIQAWFRSAISDSSRFPLNSQHQQACEAMGFDPHAKELCIKLLPTEQYAAMQEAFRSAPPALARQRAMQALNYRAALSTTTAADGGTIFAPETMMNSIEVNMLAFGGVLAVSEIIRTSGSDRCRMRWPTVNDTANKGRRLSESQAVTNTAQPSFGAVWWDLYKYTSDEILVPYELLNGTPFNLAAVLGRMMGERIGRKAADDLTTGTGVNQPGGLVTKATSYSAAAATAISWDDLDNLVSAVDPAYRLGAGFMFNDAIRGYLRKLKDGMGRPLWLAEANGAEPTSLKGYPWYINQSMDSTVASGKKTVLFGQLPKYKVRMHDEIRIYRLVERYRENDQDAFLAFAEMDGNLLDAGTAPVKYLLQP